MEEQKERELLEEFRKKGIKPPSLEGSTLFSKDPKETEAFEAFQ